MNEKCLLFYSVLVCLFMISTSACRNETPKTIVPGIRKARGTGFAKHPFFEASSMRKIRGKYYFIYYIY